MNAVDVVVLAAYASLVVELVAFPIPSEASTWQLVGARGAAPDALPTNDPLQRARGRSVARKFLVYFVPTALGVLAWLVPLAAVLSPALGDVLWVHRAEAMVLPGLACVVIGRVVTFASVLQLRAQQRRGGEPGWLFRQSRNPGLVGMFTCYLGLCCLFGSPVCWSVLPLYVANMHGRVRLEEAHLATRWGDRWHDYSASVPRYLGRRRSSTLPRSQ